MTTQTSSVSLEGRCSWFVRQKSFIVGQQVRNDAWNDGFLSTEFIQRVSDVGHENRERFCFEFHHHNGRRSMKSLLSDNKAGT